MNALEKTTSDLISDGIHALQLLRRLNITASNLVNLSVNSFDTTIHVMQGKFNELREQLGPAAADHEYGADWFTYEGVRFCK